ncbi:hypothetical protein TWF106_010838 [Orbilia oligospora]|uniref:Uncharacterized protein n=1 Tax=Orbilia oligospora TaxID=2813651 RepID=A0A7C8UJ01_ORBOL|nr:hypothetical protein TWF106_010838 [Orbilia oligospora]
MATLKLVFDSASSQRDFIDRKFIYYWKDFELNVIQSLEKSDLTGELNFADPPEGELILVGTEHGLTGRFQENVGALLGRAFNISTDKKINRLRFGDSSVVPNSGSEADVLIMTYPLSESDDITCRIVGEMKPFWTEPDIKSAKPSRIPETDDPAADAMRRASLRLGCMLGASDDYLYIDRDPERTLQALRSGKYGSEEDEEEDLSSSSLNLRRKKRDALEYENDDVDEERIEAGSSKKPRTRAATVRPSEIGALMKERLPGLGTRQKERANPRKAFLPKEVEVEVEAENSFPALGLYPIKTAFRSNRKKRSRKAPQKQALEKVALVTEPPSSLKEEPSEIYQVKDVTVYSVFFGEGEISKHLFQIQNTVQQNPDKKKRVFVGLFNGIKCIAKYFPAEDVERYS